VHPVSVQISGRDVAFGKKSADLSMFLYRMGSRGTDLELTLKAPSGVAFWIADYSVGPPTVQRRTAELMGAQSSDQTLVMSKIHAWNAGISIELILR